MLKMYPHPEARMNSQYPADRLHRLQGLIEDEMRHPDMLDHDSKHCLLVIKNGNIPDIVGDRALAAATDGLHWLIHESLVIVYTDRYEV
jgi:hypothetical protein